MIRTNDLAWRYWSATLLLLFGELADWPLGLAPAVGLVLAQIVHYGLRTGSIVAFPVQVRLGYLAWMLAGSWHPLEAMLWILLAGTAASVLADYCAMARIASLLPWNRREPLTLRLVLKTFLHPPVRGSFLAAF